MIHSKKAQFFVGFVVIMTFLALLYALIVLSSKYKVDDAYGTTRIIGEKQAALFNLYQRGENARFYAEKASEVAAINAIGNLSREKIGCDVYLGYSVWSTKDKQCTPNSKTASEKFRQEFLNKLNELFAKYSDAKLSSDNYELVVSRNLTIIGRSKSETRISPKVSSAGKLIQNLPSSTIWPASGEIRSCYGWRDLKIVNRENDWHDGVDVALKEGTDVKSVADGTVVKMCDLWKDNCACSTANNNACKLSCNSVCGPGFSGYGNFIIIKHSDGFYSRYNHLSQVLVKQGDSVSQGTLIAKSGNTGLSEGPHLHFDVYLSSDFSSDIGKGSYERNPVCYLPKMPLSNFKGDSCNDGDGIGGCGDSPKSPAYADAVYSFDTNFNATINYSFDEYQKINESMQRISEKVSQECRLGDGYPDCVNKILNDKQITGDFKFTFQCGQKAPDSRLLLVCAESRYTFMNLKGQKEPFLYKIAYFLGDSVAPKPVEGLAVVDTKKQEKNLTVSFDANSEPDMEFYNIYYSTQDFTNIREERTGENMIKFIKSVKHTGSRIGTTANVSEDNIPYYFAVTPVDTSGNENYEVKTGLSASTDDLYPGLLPEKIKFDKRPGDIPIIDILITPPETNEDDSLLNDLAGYTVYLRDAGDAVLCSINDVSAVVSDSKNKKIVQFDMSSFPNKGSLELPDSQKSYCLVAIAVDETGNTDLNDKRYSENNVIFVKI